MLQYLTLKGGKGPVILCDACQTPISDTTAGTVLFTLAGEPNEPAPPFYAHKGHCHSLMETRLLTQNDGALVWDEMRDFMVDLIQSVGIRLEA